MYQSDELLKKTTLQIDTRCDTFESEYFFVHKEEDHFVSDYEQDIDFEGKLRCVLDEIKRLKKEVVEQRDQTKNQISRVIELEKLVADLKLQLEENKRVVEVTRIELDTKEEWHTLEAEVLNLKKQLEKVNWDFKRILQNEQSTELFEKMLLSQISLPNKSRRGYEG